MSLDRYGIQPETVQSIGTFSILWCQFEQAFFEKSAYPNKIVKWARANEADEAALELCRAVRTAAQDALELNADDSHDDAGDLVFGEQYTGADKHQNLVIEFLLASDEEMLFGGCLLFIHRVRGNLFRGTEEIRGLDDQRGLFDAINVLLDACLVAKEF